MTLHPSPHMYKSKQELGASRKGSQKHEKTCLLQAKFFDTFGWSHSLRLPHKKNGDTCTAGDPGISASRQGGYIMK